jgi:hypothetical protein
MYFSRAKNRNPYLFESETEYFVAPLSAALSAVARSWLVEPAGASHFVEQSGA